MRRMPANAEQEFWSRMNLFDPAVDTPGMSCSENISSNSTIDLIVATAAGKPLLYFGLLGNDQQGGRDGATRSLEELVSLSAACVAFRHATNSRIRSIVGPQGIILSTSLGALHVAVAATDRFLPLDFLVSLAKISVTSVFFLMSSGFMAALETRPTLDLGSKSSVVQKFTALFLRRTILFPLPPIFESSVSLPYLSTPGTQKRLSSILTAALGSHPGLTHALVLSASPPFPHRTVLSVSPVYNQLSPTDHFLISCLLPMNTRQMLDLPDKIFLQAFSFNKASVIFARLVELRLAPEDFADFKAAVGGEDWRPDWSENGADAVWVVGIADVSALPELSLRKAGKAFLNVVEKGLDRTRSAMDLMVHMERPWRVSDIFEDNPILSSCVLGVIVRQSQRMVATIGALGHKRGMEVLHVIRECRILCDKKELDVIQRRSTLFSVYFKTANVWLVATADKYVFVSGVLAEERVIEICRRHIFPWLSANTTVLFSHHSHFTLRPKTPLSAFLAPFES